MKNTSLLMEFCLKVSAASIIMSALLLIALLILNRLSYKIVMIHNGDHELIRRKIRQKINLHLKKQDNGEYEIDDDILIQNNEKLEISHQNRYSSFCKESSLSKSKSERRTLVIFNGLNSDYKNSIEERVKYFFNSKNCPFDEIIVMKYPKYSFSMEGIFYYNDKDYESNTQYKIKKFFNYIVKSIRWILHKCFHYDGVIGHCETTMKELLKDYDPKKMDIFTYSMGGGIGGNTARRFGSNGVFQNGEKFHSIVHCNSFDKNYKVTGNLFKEKEGENCKAKAYNFIVCKILKKIVIALLYVISLGYHIDAKETYLESNIPVERKGVFYTQNDEIINYDGSLHNALSKASRENSNLLKEKNIELFLVESNQESQPTVRSYNNIGNKSDYLKHEGHCYIHYDKVVEFYNSNPILAL
jgi:hypothetical protein